MTELPWRVLIAGCGYVGTALGLLLCERGHRVWGLRRNAGALPFPIHPLSADLLCLGDVSRVPRGLTHVVYAAAPDGPSDAQYFQAYVAGLGNLLALDPLRSAQFRQLLLVSSTAVYGPTEGDWVDEQTPPDAQDFAGQRLLQSEALLRRSGLPHTIFRCAGIYGPGRGRLIRMARGTEPVSQPALQRFTNRIHRDDVCGAIAHLLERPPRSQVYLGVDHESARLGDVLGWLRGQLGLPAEITPSAAGEPSRRARSSRRCRGTKLRESGYRFIYPTFREGYARLLAYPSALGFGPTGDRSRLG